MALIFIPVLGGLIGKKSVPTGMVSATAPRSYRMILKQAVRFPVLTMFAVLVIIAASFASYFTAGHGVVFFPDIEPEQANVQILARGDLSAKERDALVATAETSILPVGGVQDFYAKSFRPGGGGHRHRVTQLVPSAVLKTGISATRPSLMDQMRERIAGLASADFSITKQQEGPGGSADPH